MKPGQIEVVVSEDLARELPLCSECGCEPEILKREAGVPWRTEIAVTCACDYTTYRNTQWFATLYEAVSLWTLTQKLLGSPERSGNDVPF